MRTYFGSKSTFVVCSVIVISLLWAGILLGVSFLATPVKFLAPSLTLSVALDVGRETFHVFEWVQIVLLALLVLSVFFVRPTRLLWILLFVVAVSFFLQVIWLLPILDIRVAMVEAHLALPATQVHNYYGITEMAKLVGLLWIGIGGVRALVKDAVSRAVG